ncbi:MAG: aminotransferase class I/II-fold pyridoxal phosphate-dependent enzyme [Pseudobdellovibrionaceae bacterium]
MPQNEMDLSLGDALRPFTALAQIAFAEVSGQLHKYVNNPTALGSYAEAPVKRAREAINYFTHAQGWERPDYSGYGNESTAVISGGTSRAFHLLLKTIQDAFEREKIAHGQIARPVMIMPVPTYGYFLTLPEKYGIEVVPVYRDIKDNGKLDINEVAEAVQHCHRQGKFIVGYYDCTPHNPLGFIRSEEETQEIGALFERLRYHYHGRNGIMMSGSHLSENPVFRCMPLLIDDQVYRGLQYDRDAQIPSFAGLSSPIGKSLYDQTVTLLGPSKAGLSGLRSGVMTGNAHLIKDVNELQRLECYFQDPLMLKATEHFFHPDSPHAGKVRSFLSRLNSDHRIRGHLMKALFNGMETMDELSGQDRDRLVRLTARAKNIVTEDAVKILEGGVSGVNVITTPQAGFFHVLELTDPQEDENECTLMDRVTRNYGLSYVPLTWTGYGPAKEASADGTFHDPSPYFARVTFAVPFSKLFKLGEAFHAEQLPQLR